MKEMIIQVHIFLQKIIIGQCLQVKMLNYTNNQLKKQLLLVLKKEVIKTLLKNLILKKIIKAEKKIGQEKINKNKSIFILDLVSLYRFDKSKGFIFYFTKSQIKKLTEARKEGFF